MKPGFSSEFVTERHKVEIRFSFCRLTWKLSSLWYLDKLSGMFESENRLCDKETFVIFTLIVQQFQKNTLIIFED